MRRAPFSRLVAAASFSFLAGAAVADISAGDVWARWQEQLSIYGESEMTIGGVTQSGNSLTVSGIELRAQEDGGASSVRIPQIVFVERGDGTVTITLPPQIMIGFTQDDALGENQIDMALQSVNASILVSGTPDAMVYDFAADRITLSASEIVENGKVIPADILVNANGLSGQSRQSSGEMRDLSTTFTARSVDLLIGIDDGSSRIDLSGSTASVSATSEARLPAGTSGSVQDLREFGGYLRASYESGAGTFVLAVKEDGASTNIVVGSAGNRLDMTIAAESISMGSQSADVTIGLSGDTMPFPIALSAKSLGQSFTFPVLSTDQPMPMGMTLDVGDLSLDDQIWSMLDPFGAVPHEPLTLKYTIEGTARLRHDLDATNFDDRIGEAENPFELHSANISGLVLAFAGASLTGEGAFTFDNSDTMTFPGMPRPQGRARIEAIGINTMFDRLATVGLLPEEQLMGFRMMLGMFADVVGDDHLASEIEITPAGQILLNGQRLR